MGRGWPKAGTSWGSKRAWGAQRAWRTHRTWWSQGSRGAHTSKAARGSSLLPGNSWGIRLHLRSQGASVGRGRKVETEIYVVSILQTSSQGFNQPATDRELCHLSSVHCELLLGTEKSHKFEFSWISTWSSSKELRQADAHLRTGSPGALL